MWDSGLPRAEFGGICLLLGVAASDLTSQKEDLGPQREEPGAAAKVLVVAEYQSP